MRLPTIAASVVLASLAVSAQRDAKATGTLAGVLMTDAPDPQPVRRATVRLSAGANTSTRVVGTNDDGRFMFEGLPAGSYTLSATKPGYVTTFHGSTRPGRGPGVPVAVANGARVDVALRMLRGAVIAGTITDALANPIPGIAVHALDISSGGPATPASARAHRASASVTATTSPVIAILPAAGPGRGIAATT